VKLTSDTTFYCVQCGKKIKNGFYFRGNGPYGICCYKKLYGDMTISRIRNNFRKTYNVRKEDLCEHGLIKDCEHCILAKGVCEYIEVLNDRK